MGQLYRTTLELRVAGWGTRQEGRKPNIRPQMSFRRETPWMGNAMSSSDNNNWDEADRVLDAVNDYTYPYNGADSRSKDVYADTGAEDDGSLSVNVDALDYLDGPPTRNSAPRSVRRALLTPQVNPESRYHCGKRN